MPRCVAGGLDDASSSSRTPPPAASTRAPPTPPPPSAPPLPLGYYDDEDELAIVAGAAIALVESSAAQPRASSSVPPLPTKKGPLVVSSSGVLDVEGDFADVETGRQQQRCRAFTVVVQPPPLQQAQPQRPSAWRRAGRAVWRFCGVVAQAFGLVLLVVAAALLLLLFVVASAVEWCRGRETCHW